MATPDEQIEHGGTRRSYAPEDTRQGEIVLKTLWRRTIFIAGLAGIVVLVIVVTIFSGR
ncbi:hypothetical protein [Aurantimonas sp. VKM B-3413]|uniref:hypothetical protein n=1 Tax=Aurantimonas sp. VKM B-3413 TaxID=2779401 RepID=UPI001E2A35FA|nr:hypothetical protein [Aurantimonas sp. VKM B-3413]MCB8836554.1 hypothetical protein [Aurantimonas sp. VKM B-3413]